MTACWVHGCTAPATRTVQIQAPGWRVPESRRVCIAHADRITQEPPMSKTQPTQAERVLEDVKNNPWTTVGDVVRRTRDAKAAARLVEAVQAGRIVRIGEQRSYRYALPGTPIPGLAEPVSAADQLAPVVEESPDFGIADPPTATERRPTLAERLARAVGVDLTGGDAAIVEAVERIAAERDELAEKLEGWTDVLERTREQRDAFEALANRAAAAGEGLGGAVLRIAEALGCELSPTEQRPVVDLALDAARSLEERKNAYWNDLFALRNSLHAELMPDGNLNDRELMGLLRQRLATPTKIPDTIVATANANLREIGGGVAKRRVGCTVALGSGSAFFALSDEAARLLAPLLFQGVTVALLAPSPSKPTPVVPEFPSAPTPDDDQDMTF